MIVNELKEMHGGMAFFALVLLAILGNILVGGLAVLIGWSDFESLSITEMMLLNIVSAVFSLGLPAMFLAYLDPKPMLKFLRLDRGIRLGPAVITALATIVLIPLLLQTLKWNYMMELPAFLSEIEAWMREMEEFAAELTKDILTMNTIGQLVFALITVAVFPALTEELFFRGGIQQALRKGMGNPHVAIWLTGAIFSAIHFQFFGFIPRMLMGVMMGYLFYWSKNLWYPILAHFLNNGLQVIGVYFGNQEIEAEPEMIGQSPGWTGVVIGSLVLTCLLFYAFRRYFMQNPVAEDGQVLSSKAPEALLEDLELQNKENWVKVYSTHQEYLGEIARSVLLEHEVVSFILDKRDSSYQFGDIELYCHPKDQERAALLLQELNEK